MTHQLPNRWLCFLSFILAPLTSSDLTSERSRNTHFPIQSHPYSSRMLGSDYRGFANARHAAGKAHELKEEKVTSRLPIGCQTRRTPKPHPLPERFCLCVRADTGDRRCRQESTEHRSEKYLSNGAAVAETVVSKQKLQYHGPRARSSHSRKKRSAARGERQEVSVNQVIPQTS